MIQIAVPKLYYKWTEFYDDAEYLAKKIKGQNFEGILAITKGGLFLASYLSSRLNIKYVDTYCVESYKDMERSPLHVIKEPKPEKLPKNLLIVDDIADSGHTLKYVQERYKAPSVVLFRKSHTIFEPTYHVHSVDEKTWIVFPWEELGK